MRNKKTFCRISGQPLKIINDFGKQPLGNGFLRKKDFNKEYFFEMKTGFCNYSKMFQLFYQPSPIKKEPRFRNWIDAEIYRVKMSQK